MGLKEFREKYENLEKNLSEEDKKSLAILIGASGEVAYFIGFLEGRNKSPEEYCSEEVIKIKKYIVEKNKMFGGK